MSFTRLIGGLSHLEDGVDGFVSWELFYFGCGAGVVFIVKTGQHYVCFVLAAVENVGR